MKTIKFEIEDWSENANENVDHSEVYVNIDGSWIGHIRVNNEDGHIEYVEINSDFRGKGIYKMLLIAALNLGNFDYLISNDRNSLSNVAYEKWINQPVPKEKIVYISLDGEKLNFEL